MLYFQDFSIENDKKKPLLIILHGLFGSSDNWRTWARLLSHHFEVILPDLRNHGKSFVTAGMNYRDLAEDVIEVIESINDGNREVHLLGHSVGGKIAMVIALKRKDLISSLIVGDIGPKIYPPTHQAVLDGLSALAKKIFSTLKEADQILSSYITDSRLRSFLLKNLRRGNEGFLLYAGMEEIITSYREILDWPDFLKEMNYNGPVLFMKGENSPYLKERDYQDIKKLFPRASIALIENSGHWFHVENPHRVKQELSSFYKLRF